MASGTSSSSMPITCGTSRRRRPSARSIMKKASPSASLCAEIATALIADRLFDLPVRLHPWLWLVLPSALLVGMSGWLTTRHITRVPPMQSMRALG